MPWDRTVVVVTKKKEFWRSKIVWANAITFLVIVLSLTEVRTLIPPEGGRYIAAALAVLNVVLRLFFSDTNLTMKTPTEEG